MNLEHLLQTTATAKREEAKPVSPTLIVGLGGTGKEVLLRLRRLIVERYGRLSALPFIQFLHLDTDKTTNATEQYDLRSSDDPLFKEVSFRPSERLNLTVDGGTGRYVEHIHSYPHIKRWFPTTGKIAELGDLGQGAGQVRVASRLGFYHPPNFNKISASLEQARRRLSDPAILNRVGDLGFEFDSTSMDIFVICSLAGGTGGGTFLDMGFLLQRFFDKATVVGILMLPSFFAAYAGGTRVKANGYAALMELNHYSFGHTFLADWENTQSSQVVPPPFDFTYLIDGTNEAGLSIPSGGAEMDAYQMVAEVLFQDYSLGNFAGAKRATRVNLVNFNLEVYSHNFLNDALRNSGRGSSSERNVVGDTFPARFGSFGFSAIAFPTDRLHNACSARMATEILDFWQKTLLEDPLERLFTRFLSHADVQFAQGRFERRDGGGVLQRSDIEDALLVYQEGGGRTFDSFLWEKAQKIRQLLEATPVSQKAAVLEQQLAELERLFAKEDSDDPEEWGLGVRQLESNKRHYLERVRQAIEKRAQETADDPKYGVAYTLSLLRELKALLHSEHFNYLPYFEGRIPLWRDETQDQSYSLDQLRLDISRHENQKLFRGAHLRWDLERLVGESDSASPGALYSYFYARVMKQIAKRGKAICEAVDEFLGKDDATGEGLLARYWQLLTSFAKLKELLEKKQAYFVQEKKSELFVSLYQESDFEDWYQRWVGEGGQRQASLERIGNQLLQDVFDVPTVTAAMVRIQNEPAEEIEGRILAHCKSFFAQQKAQPEALEILLSKYTPDERRRRVLRAFKLAKVWLEPPHSNLDHATIRPVMADQHPCLIGVDTENSSRYPEFKSLVADLRSPGDTEPSYKNLGTGNRGAILFYNELAGVPAFYSGAIVRPGGLRSAYLGWEEKDDLHFDKNRFQFGDLIPKTPQEARRYTESVRAFVLGRALGLLKVRELTDDSNQPIFHYSYTRNVTLGQEDVRLGTEAQAIDALYRDGREEHQTDRRQLLEAVDDIVLHLRQDGFLWLYVMLLDFYIYKVYPPQTDESWIANLTILQYSPEHAVLAAARDQVEVMLPSEEERKKLREALDSKRHDKQGEAMGYEDYLTAMGRHVRMEGKFRGQSQGVLLEKPTYHPAPVLDSKGLWGEKPRRPAKASAPAPARDHGERPCPNCGEALDTRAIYCVHCKQTVAQHVTCSHCGEARVPSDLEHCWKCGTSMRQGKKIQCPSCYSWSGYEEEFPCRICGHSLGQPIAMAVESSESAASPAIPKPSKKANGSPVRRAKVAPPEPPASTAEDLDETAGGDSPAELVECPTCYQRVPPGPKCSVCDGLL